MNCEDARRELHRAVTKMADHQWKSAQEIVLSLYAKLDKPKQKHPRGDAHSI